MRAMSREVTRPSPFASADFGLDGVAVAVRGTAVLVGVADRGIGVLVGVAVLVDVCAGVLVAGIGVFVGVLVGLFVAVGGTGVLVAVGVLVGAAVLVGVAVSDGALASGTGMTSCSPCAKTPWLTKPPVAVPWNWLSMT